METPRWALGIDIGGTNVKMGIVRQDGAVLAFRRYPSAARGSSAGQFVAQMQAAAAAIMREHPTPLIGIGVSTHGFLNAERTAPVVCEATPALSGVNIPALFGDAFGLPVRLCNDLVAHALAQYWFGVGQGVERFMCMAIGTGLGAGVIVDGRPLTFAGGSTGDTGRLILLPGGPECTYGVAGSAEALCGTAAIERLAAQTYGYPVPAHEVIAAARQGTDGRATAVLAEIGAVVGWVVASLSAIFQPQRVALTGGTAEAGAALLEPVRRRYQELTGEYTRILAKASGGAYGPAEIVLGELREQSGVLGAAALLFQREEPA